jgi:homogentisate 1,2-dioxygenase
LYQEHCVTRAGFEMAYSILYHVNPPTRTIATEPSERENDRAPLAAEMNGALDFPRRRRHLKTGDLKAGGDYLSSRRAVMHNADMTLSMARPRENASDFYSNGDADELAFFHKGSGRLESQFGVVEFGERDYVLIPRACIHRWRFDSPEVEMLVFEGRRDIQIPAWYKNDFGQLRMDAPYTYRDFRLPDRMPWTPDEPLPSPEGPGGFRVVVKSQDRLSDHYFEHYPLDVVGWDGWVYPIAFNIMDYQPKTGAIHLPPTIHTTFASRSDARGVGARYVICSFVPRMLDYREGAIPCPYHHSSPDCDEMLFYVDGNFTSRRGIQPGSISLHPTGIPHGPHPGTYEKSIGVKRTDELAVMMDTYTPMRLTEIGKAIEAPEYQETWL